MQRTAELGNGRRITVKAEIPHLKGNPLPYFSITAAIYAGGRVDACGCLHDEILAQWPDLAPLVALHLSDINGVPLHAEANGWYWLAGAAGGLQQQFHGSNDSARHTPEQCVDILCGHLRIAREDAALLIARVKSRAAAMGMSSARSWFNAYVAGQARRWKAEAEKAIADFGLEVAK